MKKLFSSIAALSFAIVSFSAAAETAPEATPEAKAEPAAAPAPAVNNSSNVALPQEISDHLSQRFSGQTVQGMHREGVTYVVDLGNGYHVRYDNCYNPICYGYHNHDCMHDND